MGPRGPAGPPGKNGDDVSGLSLRVTPTLVALPAPPGEQELPGSGTCHQRCVLVLRVKLASLGAPESGVPPAPR